LGEYQISGNVISFFLGVFLIMKEEKEIGNKRSGENTKMKEGCGKLSIQFNGRIGPEMLFNDVLFESQLNLCQYKHHKDLHGY